MSNMPSTDKTRLTMRVKLEVRAKLRTYCRAHSLTENDVMSAAIDDYLANVEASPEDLEWAKKEKKKNDSKRRK